MLFLIAQLKRFGTLNATQKNRSPQFRGETVPLGHGSCARPLPRIMTLLLELGCSKTALLKSPVYTVTLLLGPGSCVPLPPGLITSLLDTELGELGHPTVLMSPVTGP